MTTFILSIVALLLGYLLYGLFVEKVFGVDSLRTTPAIEKNDGVDFIPMPTWKIFLIQFLNIAGTGPIFGAILGILYGPSAYLWIVLGCIFGGAVHDYFSGVISLRKNGASLPEIVGDELGKPSRVSMRFLSLVLMVLVGAVFTTTPAGLLSSLTLGLGDVFTIRFWSVIIMGYYLLATLLPIDKLIGRIYPFFGLALLIMAVGVFVGIFTHEGFLPEIDSAFINHNPSNSVPMFPGICITIACGAVSGFHATQSPLMARCLKNEKYARPVFYGAMITEGFVALIWAAAAIKFASALDVQGDTPYEKLLAALTENGAHTANPAILVSNLCRSWLGSVGSILAILGVVFAPITTGDTAFRCARLIAADSFHIKQNRISRRIFMSIPIFACSILLMFMDFPVLWRYFAWFNQTLSIFTFYAITVWLVKENKKYIVSLIPAMWMSIVCSSYIFVAPEGFQLSPLVGNVLGCAFGLGLFLWFVMWKNRYNKVIQRKKGL